METILRRAGGILAFLSLAVVLYGIWHGAKRPFGRTSGRMASWLHSPLFYFLATAAYLGFSIAFWKPIPLSLKPDVHLAVIISGSIVFFPGILFLLWARITLGKMYFVSTSFGAQLYADHRLITHGPYAFVRHPMYLGLILSALGSLLLYQTWTTLAYVVFAALIMLRARREEQALADEFGKEWQEYCRRVPAFFPFQKGIFNRKR